MSHDDEHLEYDDTFVAGLEWMWGEGFLSPGGRDEVAEILRGVPVEGATVLDVGCGLGAIDCLLVETHGAARVVGVDVEQPLVDQARERIRAAGLGERVQIMKVKPGPLPFGDGTFDLVFSKDAMIHIPDKRALFADVHRVLRPGGRLAISDWYGNGEPPSEAMRAWLDVVGLTFDLESIEVSAGHARAAGFVDVETRDRNDWYRETIRDELATITGENYPRLVEHLGKSAAEQRVASTSQKQRIVDGGELRPGHLRARKS